MNIIGSNDGSHTSKSRHKQVRSILASDTWRGQSASLPAQKGGNSPEIRATLRSCHSFGDGRERRANGVVLARADMELFARGVGGKKKAGVVGEGGEKGE